MSQAQGTQSSGVSTVLAAESAGVESLIGRLRDEGITQGRGKPMRSSPRRSNRPPTWSRPPSGKRKRFWSRPRRRPKNSKPPAKTPFAWRCAIQFWRWKATSSRGSWTDCAAWSRGSSLIQRFSQRLILEVGGRAAPTSARAELLLPAELVSLEDLQSKPEEATPGTLMHLRALPGRRHAA